MSRGPDGHSVSNPNPVNSMNILQLIHSDVNYLRSSESECLIADDATNESSSLSAGTAVDTHH